MADKKKRLTKELNLGLTEILSAAQGSDPGGVTTSQGPTTTETSIVTFEDDLERLSPELSGLAERKQWGILVSRAETAITSEEDIEARLWWVRGHLGAFTLPVSLLAAPFETVCRQLTDDVRVDTFRQLLKEIGEIMLERLRGVGDRRQEYAVRLALYQLGVMEPDEKSKNSYGKIPPKVVQFDEAPAATVHEEAPPSKPTEEKKRYRWITLTSALLLVFFGTGFFITRAYLAKPNLLIADEDLLGADQVAVTQQPPVLARHVSSNLGAIYYSIGEDRKGTDEPRVSGIAQTDGGLEKAGTSGAVVPDQPARPPAPDISRAKEKIRTDGPIEGPEFARGVEPKLVPEARLPEVSLPDLSSSVPASSYPDGSLNIGGEVKSTIVETDVYQSPDFSARVIARLAAGDKVSVEGSVGQWLRIRSRRGRAGFVLAQDVGELEDFRR
jgi:hypothetical protein